MSVLRGQVKTRRAVVVCHVGHVVKQQLVTEITADQQLHNLERRVRSGSRVGDRGVRGRQGVGRVETGGGGWSETGG